MAKRRVPELLDPVPFRVGRSNTGLGLFATRPIKKGDAIVEYIGDRLASDEADEVNSKYLFEINDKITVNGAPRYNKARYINHGCKPNAETEIIRSRIFILAKKDIEPGDEITYHYGKNYFKHFIKPIGCKCAHCLKKAAKKAKKEAKKAAEELVERKAA